MLLRGCREPTPYTAPAAPAPCGDGQKFHPGRACPRGGGPVGASVGRIKRTAELFCFVLFFGVFFFLFFEFYEVLSFLSFFEFFEFWGGPVGPWGRAVAWSR